MPHITLAIIEPQVIHQATELGVFEAPNPVANADTIEEHITTFLAELERVKANPSEETLKAHLTLAAGRVLGALVIQARLCQSSLEQAMGARLELRPIKCKANLPSNLPTFGAQLSYLAWLKRSEPWRAEIEIKAIATTVIETAHIWAQRSAAECLQAAMIAGR